MAADLRPAGPSATATTLEDRVGPRDKRIEAEAIARAEAALEVLSSNFSTWLKEDVDRLARSRDGVRRAPEGEALDPLFTAALDLKGLGQTYGFPYVTRIAASLCKLLGDGGDRLLGSMALLDAHVDAIRLAVRDGIRDDHPELTKLATRLEALTSEAVERSGSSDRC